MAKYWFVEGTFGWFICITANKKAARSQGVNEFGYGNTRTVREATPEEIADYRQQRPGALEEGEGEND